VTLGTRTTTRIPTVMRMVIMGTNIASTHTEPMATRRVRRRFGSAVTRPSPDTGRSTAFCGDRRRSAPHVGAKLQILKSVLLGGSVG
jgi:hypothetical protein